LQIHADDPTFGYRFITDELRAEHGIRASEKRVHRLCSCHGILSVLSRKRGRGMKPGPAVQDDLVRREFSAAAPNLLWLSVSTKQDRVGATEVR
jgi:putative transposase